MIDTGFVRSAASVPDGWSAGRPRAREVAAYLHAELTAAGVTGMIVTATARLAVLSIVDDLAIWTNGAQAWWREGTRVRCHAVAGRAELRRLVFGRYCGRRRFASGIERSADEVRAAGERLRADLFERGITRQDMDVFADSRVATIYACGERRRVTVTVAGGGYIWPESAAPPGRLRCRPWHDVERAAVEIAVRLRDGADERT